MALDVKQHVIQTTMQRFEESLQHMYNLGFEEGKKSVWHPYPQEKPVESGYYLVTTDSRFNDSVDIAWFDAKMAGLLQWNKASEILAWTELPKPYNSICDDDCEHCDWATCPKEEGDDE